MKTRIKYILFFLAGVLIAFMLATIVLAVIISRNPDFLGSSSGQTAPLSSESGTDVSEEADNASSVINIRSGKTYTYIGIDELDCYKEPDGASEVIYTLNSGDQIEVTSRKGDYYYFLSPLGYCYAPREQFLKGKAYVNLPGAVDLRGYIPEALYSIDFATPDNVTGMALYPPIPLMEENTAELLLEAYNIFKEDGYIMKICDAYRPVSAQQALFNKVQNSAFIADPAKGGSWHNVGRAIDLTLIDEYTGMEVEMPTEMHRLDYSAARSGASSWTEDARNNVDYMTKVMKSVGFTTINSEWWHFEYTGDGGIMPKELDYSTLQYTVQ